MSTHSNPITNVVRKSRIRFRKLQKCVCPKRIEKIEKYSMLELSLTKIKRMIS